jgi:hypothetical protein
MLQLKAEAREERGLTGSRLDILNHFTVRGLCGVVSPAPLHFSLILASRCGRWDRYSMDMPDEGNFSEFSKFSFLQTSAAGTGGEGFECEKSRGCQMIPILCDCILYFVLLPEEICGILRAMQTSLLGSLPAAATSNRTGPSPTWKFGPPVAAVATCACAPASLPERAKEEGHIRHCLADSTDPATASPVHPTRAARSVWSRRRVVEVSIGRSVANTAATSKLNPPNPFQVPLPPPSVAIMIGQFHPRSPAFPVDEEARRKPWLVLAAAPPPGHATGTRSRSLAPKRYTVTPNETGRNPPFHFCYRALVAVPEISLSSISPTCF